MAAAAWSTSAGYSATPYGSSAFAAASAGAAAAAYDPASQFGALTNNHPTYGARPPGAAAAGATPGANSAFGMYSAAGAAQAAHPQPQLAGNSQPGYQPRPLSVPAQQQQQQQENILPPSDNANW